MQMTKRPHDGCKARSGAGKRKGITGTTKKKQQQTSAGGESERIERVKRKGSIGSHRRVGRKKRDTQMRYICLVRWRASVKPGADKFSKIATLPVTSSTAQKEQKVPSCDALTPGLRLEESAQE